MKLLFLETDCCLDEYGRTLFDPESIDEIKHYVDEGYDIVLHSCCRHNADELEIITDALANHDIPLHGVVEATFLCKDESISEYIRFHFPVEYKAKKISDIRIVDFDDHKFNEYTGSRFKNLMVSDNLYRWTLNSELHDNN